MSTETFRVKTAKVTVRKLEVVVTLMRGSMKPQWGGSIERVEIQILLFLYSNGGIYRQTTELKLLLEKNQKETN